jgi:hypothetical protein
MPFGGIDIIVLYRIASHRSGFCCKSREEVVKHCIIHHIMSTSLDASYLVSYFVLGVCNDSCKAGYRTPGHSF